ncbi:CRISPR-associated RAMP protein, Csm5 family [Flexistipes sinusarabici DSM 4947]|uniref:CRISPR system Cms protein Csm5 n=1 Tax=Flexistipes sinusarabici (strain ATCC 49648 / DSM 4947 / MAS 10) TaxID=717231 RepID=F8E7K2_FLESM|nr:type III-A CRISPR-associated RAMP protein Csm5 [Flexistipes sinusarabici]AEI14989.1 CRISPR-associated RAMP protein, Csm5 family [Flexistipes sinusarabici DSM 4947]
MSMICKYNIQAFLASPVHIGTGEMYDPFSYVIKGNVFYHFETAAFLSNLSSEKTKQFTYILKNPSRDSILKSREFIYNNFDADVMKDIIIDEIDLSKSSFPKDYEEKLSDLANKDPRNKAINLLEIEQTYSSGGFPIIPGSSLKGSIRTAIINQLIEDNNIRVDKGRYSYKKLMRDMDLSYQNDIFDMLKISDFHKENAGKWIGYFKNYPKSKMEKSISQNNQIDVATEVLRPFQVFKGEINIFPKEKRHQFEKQFNDITKTKVNIFKCLNRHYLDLFKQEYNFFKKKNPKSNFFKIIEQKNFLEKLESNEYAVLKVGKHSGAEGVTFKDRAIFIKGSKNKDAKYDAKTSTTTWYFSQKKELSVPNLLYPLGWIILI